MSRKRVRSAARGPRTGVAPSALPRGDADAADAADAAARRPVTYRELRNTPGRVWKRLANNQPLTLVADGEAKAIVIPVRGGDAEGALEAYRRGRAIMAVARIRKRARETGASRLTLAEINTMIREVRADRAAAERAREGE